MQLRAQTSHSELIDGLSVKEYAKQNLYPTAYPFDRCNAGGPGSIAHVAIHGYNGLVTAVADLWPLNIIRTLPTAGFTIGVSSGNAADAVAGTGARTVEIDLLDTSYIPHTITLNLNGQTKVSDTAYVGTAFRINDIRITAWGSGRQNAGVIYVYDASDTVGAGVPQTTTKIFHCINATNNVSAGGFYTVPAGCKLQAQKIFACLNDSEVTARAGVVSIMSFKNTAGGLVPSYTMLPGQLSLYSPSFTIVPDFYPVHDEKTDLVLRATCSGAAIMLAYVDAILFYK